MGKSKLNDNAGLADVQMAYDFDLIIPNVPGIVTDINDLKARIQTTAIPGRSIDKHQLILHGSTTEHAGMTQYTRTLPFQMVETRDANAYRFFNAWHRFTRDDSSLGAYHEEYKTEIELYLYDAKDKVSQAFRLYGCWLESFDDASLDGGSTAAVEVSGTLSYDRWEYISN